VPEDALGPAGYGLVAVGGWQTLWCSHTVRYVYSCHFTSYIVTATLCCLPHQSSIRLPTFIALSLAVRRRATLTSNNPNIQPNTSTADGDKKQKS